MVVHKECECRKTAVGRIATRKSPYHFVDSGLPNVYLAGIKYWVCQKCGKQSANIPALNELMIKIARAVVGQEARLNGAEIRFLRKRLKKKSAEFGKIIGVTPEQISRWENDGNRPSESADKLIRVFFCLLSGDGTLQDKVTKHIDDWMATLPGDEHATNFQAQLLDHEWAAGTVPA